MGGKVFPLYDDNPLKLPVPPLATWVLIALSVALMRPRTVELFACTEQPGEGEGATAS